MFQERFPWKIKWTLKSSVRNFFFLHPIHKQHIAVGLWTDDFNMTWKYIHRRIFFWNWTQFVKHCFVKMKQKIIMRINKRFNEAESLKIILQSSLTRFFFLKRFFLCFTDDTHCWGEQSTAFDILKWIINKI